jgi:F-type H+-transporting ATPase subunit epsilon
MPDFMNVEILSPDAQLFQGDADVITLPGTTGSFQIKNNHAALISSLQTGTITVENGNEKTLFDISGGLVEVIKNKITILV